MSIFSRSSKNQNQSSPEPSTTAPVQPDLTLEELKLQNEELKRMLKNVSENVIIVNDNVRLLINRVNTLQSDLHVSLNNDQLMERYFQSLEADIKQIRHAVNSLNR